MVEKIIIITLIVWSVYGVFANGMILSPVSRWMSRWMPAWLQKPVYACTACMSFWYGTAGYWIIWGTSWQEWIIVVAATVGLNVILVNFQPND